MTKKIFYDKINCFIFEVNNVPVYEFVDPKEDKSYWWTVKGEDIWDELREHKIYDKNINNTVETLL